MASRPLTRSSPSSPSRELVTKGDYLREITIQKDKISISEKKIDDYFDELKELEKGIATERSLVSRCKDRITDYNTQIEKLKPSKLLDDDLIHIDNKPSSAKKKSCITGRKSLDKTMAYSLHDAGITIEDMCHGFELQILHYLGENYNVDTLAGKSTLCEEKGWTDEQCQTFRDTVRKIFETINGTKHRLYMADISSWVESQKEKVLRFLSSNYYIRSNHKRARR